MKQIIWSLGLDDEQAKSVQDFAGEQYAVHCWAEGSLPDFSNVVELRTPCLICFTFQSCKKFMTLPLDETGFLELTPKALLLDGSATREQLEEALTWGISDIIVPPLAQPRFAACLRKAAEAAALQRDIQNMAREIFVEREMLERKNETLSFLVNFLTQTSESFNEAELLEKAFDCLQKLFPVLAMHAGMLAQNADGRFEAELFTATSPDSPVYDLWRAKLLQTAESMLEGAPMTLKDRNLALSLETAATAAPADGHILALPMRINERLQFFLMLLTPLERNLSRDQAMALDSALRHMALCLKHAKNYQEMCHFADRDSLTGAYNRRSFEQILNAEAARRERYKTELSLLMLDIDHFKAVNDTWGHLKGDEVLRAVSGVIAATIRQTDYCARYGGEEFVVLLPHTSTRNAAWLAERLRRKIQKLNMTNGKDRFTVTASLGVSSILPGEKKDALTLVGEADKALYQAKEEGRNRVVTFASEHMKAASV